MAQSGFTPISLYFSATGAAVPTAGNLVAGELALNTNDGKLYFKNSSGVVTLLAGSTSGPAGGSTTQVQYNNAGVLAGITGATTNGTALTLVAPNLGTPASATLTLATGLPISTGVSGLGTGIATALAVNVGTAGAPVVNGGALGSPSSVGTMPAFTLGGTVSGGGNQINNVIIGTTTPLAGAFTTLSATGTSTLAAVNASGEIRRSLSSDTVYSASTLNADHGLSVYNGSVTANSYASIEFINRASGTSQAGISSVTPSATNSALAFQVMTANVVSEPMRLSGTGLAVTGTLSATGTLSGGTSGTAYSFSGSAPATSLTLDSSGNLGLGVTPSASSFTTMQIQNASLSGRASDTSVMFLTANASFDGANFKYISTNLACQYRQQSGEHYWYTAPSGTAGNTISFTQAMALNNIGGLQALNTIGVGNATPSASGAGITFPATQSASSNANTLDDYEEGTWTPTQGAGVTVVGTFGSSGTYTKIGNVVVLRGEVTGTTSIAVTANSVLFGGLPFTGIVPYSIGSATSGNMNTTGSILIASTVAYSTAFAATSAIYFTVTYFV